MRMNGNALVVLLLLTVVVGTIVFLAMRSASVESAAPMPEKKNPILDKVRASVARPADEEEITGQR